MSESFPFPRRRDSSCRLEGIDRIAVLRANALGDFIFVLPALAALRATYPAAEILLLGQDWHVDLLSARPGPWDRVVAIPPSKGVRADRPPVPEEELERFFERMAEERLDLALQLHGGGRYSNPFLLRLGARVTAGLRAPDAVPLDRWVPYIYYQPEVFRFLEVVSLVGARPVALEPRLQVTEADLVASLEAVPEREQPLVLLHPGAGDPRRRWPIEKFAALGDLLAAAGARVAVTGTEAEMSLARGVVEGMEGEAENLCGRLSLGALTGLLARAYLLVSNDSGPLHLAAAVGVPTVGIFWCGNVINAGPLWRSHHRPALSWRLTCPVCGIDTTHVRCEHDASFVADVSVEEVAASALDLLASGGRDRYNELRDTVSL